MSRTSGSTSPSSSTTKPQPSPMPQTSQSTVAHDKIAMRAYQKWVKRGCPQGTDKQDWLEAEAELKAEIAKNSTHSSPSSQPRR